MFHVKRFCLVLTRFEEHSSEATEMSWQCKQIIYLHNLQSITQPKRQKKRIINLSIGRDGCCSFKDQITTSNGVWNLCNNYGEIGLG